jgi:hypothetical protein
LSISPCADEHSTTLCSWFMIEIPDRGEWDEALPQRPIITSHRLTAPRVRRKRLRSSDGSPE